MSETSVTNEIDRITPTCCPSGRNVMWQNWSDLLFLHWILPADSLRRLLPPGLELDTFEGRAYVGLVPFTMTNVRPVWAPPVSPLSNFHETNVRTYVHVNGRDPGVWFFSLDAANPIAVRLARIWFKLPYYYARMRLDRAVSQGDGAMRREQISYASERLWPGPVPAACAVSCSPDGAVRPAEVGTLEHFLVERYLLYAYRDGTLYRGQVNHIHYPLQTALVDGLEENLIAAAGIQRPDEPPLAHYAQGVKVKVFPLHRVKRQV